MRARDVRYANELANLWVKAMADAARVYGKRIKARVETTNYAAEIRLRAERRLGKILEKTPMNKGDQG